MDLFNRVKSIIAEVAQIKEEEISESSTVESLNLDSLDTTEILVDLEDKLLIEIDESALFVYCKTVGDLVEHLETKLKSGEI
jgi:acyl carrier protein